MAETDATTTQETGSDDAASRGRASKSPAAFRTISEAANELELPQHVLRFWESKFPQLKPLKRGGGRRYYRPEDIELLTRIRDWLHVEGYTIKGVQKLLRDPAQRNGTASNGGDTPEIAAEATAPTHADNTEAKRADGATLDEIDRAIERLTVLRRNLLDALDD